MVGVVIRSQQGHLADNLCQIHVHTLREAHPCKLHQPNPRITLAPPQTTLKITSSPADDVQTQPDSASSKKGADQTRDKPAAPKSITAAKPGKKGADQSDSKQQGVKFTYSLQVCECFWLRVAPTHNVHRHQRCLNELESSFQCSETFKRQLFLSTSYSGRKREPVDRQDASLHRVRPTSGPGLLEQRQQPKAEVRCFVCAWLCV